jgi:hypothetical protein
LDGKKSWNTRYEGKNIRKQESVTRLLNSGITKRVRGGNEKVWRGGKINTCKNALTDYNGSTVKNCMDIKTAEIQGTNIEQAMVGITETCI